MTGMTTVARAARTVSVVASPPLILARRRLYRGVNKYATMAAITINMK